MTTLGTTQFALPQFNINGTSARTVEDEYHSALNALRIAEQLLIDATCHGRDFQMQSPDCYEKAREERAQALKCLSHVHDYLSAWYWNAVDFQ